MIVNIIAKSKVTREYSLDNELISKLFKLF